MKKALWLLLLVVASVSAQSSIEISEKNLVGKWLFKDIVEDGGEDNGMSLQERKQLLEGVYLTFRDDKTCTVGIIVDREGTWSLDGKIISIEQKSKASTWTIHSFTAKEMVMSRNESKQKILFIRQ